MPLSETRTRVLELLGRLRGRGYYSAGEVAAILDEPRARVKSALDELAAGGELQTRTMSFDRNGADRTGTGYAVVVRASSCIYAVGPRGEMCLAPTAAGAEHCTEHEAKVEAALDALLPRRTS